MTESQDQTIANSLTRDILTGRYSPGDRLPSERELAARLNVSRGAVREAIKRLEMLGIADVQPGGARVAPVEEASLDVIGHLLELEAAPDPDLVDQILQVMTALMAFATETAVVNGTDAQLAEIRRLVQQLKGSVVRRVDDVVTRFEVMRAVMEASANLVIRLIARALLIQFVPRLARVVPADELALQYPDHYVEHLDALDLAIAERNPAAARRAVVAMSAFDIELAMAELARAQAQTDTVAQSMESAS